MVARQALGALAILAGARSVFANDLEVRDTCEPVTITNVQYCTVSVLEKITELLYATATVTVTGKGATVGVTDTVSLPYTTVSATTATYTTGIYSNVTVSVPTTVVSVSPSNVTVSVPTTIVSVSPSNVTVSVPTTVLETVTPSSSIVPSSSVAPSSTIASSSSASASTAPLPTSCDNTGIDFAYYTHNYTDNNDGDNYANFDVDYFKTATPELVNVTNEMGLQVESNGDTDTYIYSSIYDSAGEYQVQFMAINHHTYLFAIESGTYSLNAVNVDDAMFIWVGEDAYSGWTRDNDVMEAIYSDGSAGQTYTFEATAGDYVPLRFLFAQAQGQGGFDFTLTSPSGEVLVSSDTTSSPYIFRFSCDLTTAPKFPEFGAEY